MNIVSQPISENFHWMITPSQHDMMWSLVWVFGWSMLRILWLIMRSIFNVFEIVIFQEVLLVEFSTLQFWCHEFTMISSIFLFKIKVFAVLYYPWSSSSYLEIAFYLRTRVLLLVVYIRNQLSNFISDKSQLWM